MKKSVVVLTAIFALGVFASEAVMLKPTAAYAAQTADAQEQPGNNTNGGYDAWGTTPLVPAELFEAGADLAILAILLYLFPRRKFDGQVGLAYFVLYSVARFALEFWRTDSLMIGGIKAAQATALLTAVIAAGLLICYGARRIAAARN